MMKQLTDSVVLRNGVALPCVGFGTWQTPNGETAVEAIACAIREGYRHIDTAAAYHNEESVGRAIRESGVSREDLFVTSKVWNSNRGYDTTMAAFENTMNKLEMDVLDLYLIHWPAVEKQFDEWNEINLSTWKALTELYRAGRIRAIGVSNFLPHHLASLMETEVAPMVNQIEFHPGFMQAETVAFCRQHGIAVEAWSPLGTGALLSNERLCSLAAKYGKSAAQLCIRWCLQNGTVPLPKSVTPSRIAENTQVFDFEISAEDMGTINAMSACGGSGLNPDEVDF